jgi:hypothetical protein
MTQTTISSTVKRLAAADEIISSLGSAANIKIYTTSLALLLATFTLGATPIVATVTVDAGTDIFTEVAHGFSIGTPLRFTTSGTLPAGLALLTTYYARDITTDTFKVSATPSGTAIDITTTGTGTHAVQGQAYNVSSTGVITSNNGANPFVSTAVGAGTAAEATYTKADGTVIYTTNVGLQPISFAVDTATEIITAPYHNFANGDKVKFIGAALPSPLVINTEYEVGDVTNVGLVNAAFKVYKDRAVVNITTAGTAPQTVTTFAGVQINTGTSVIPSLVITSGQVLAIASISITPQ